MFGCEKERGEDYEVHLKKYERAAVRANIWNAALPPVYKVIAMAGTVMILYFGSKNILGSGWTSWDVASFTTFLACYTKLSDKSSKAAKLFNAVQSCRIELSGLFLVSSPRSLDDPFHLLCDNIGKRRKDQ